VDRRRPGGRAALHDGWRVASDPRDRGRRRGWARGGFAGRAVAVPHVPGARSVTGPGGRRAHRGSVAWYRRDLRASQSGRHVLRFESVNHRATVYLDGRRVARHVGTYLPFEVAVDLREGRAHRLVVRADWRDPTR
jgi:beta-galactosidase/beta-glucuronidase